MELLKKILQKFLLPFAIISILFIIFSINFFRYDIFVERNSLSSVEYLVFIGFVVIILFLILSEVWMINYSIVQNDFSWNQSIMILFGVACFIMLFAEKVMADEIGRELVLGWETIGETIILNLLLIIQLVYVFFLFKKIKSS